MRAIWYGAYGSNISLGRFSEHLGVNPEDRHFPFTDWMSVTGSVRFAGMSSRWGGGAAFLDVAGSDALALRVYRLLPDQFLKIWESENGMGIENWKQIQADLPFAEQHETVRAEFTETPDGVKGKYDSAVMLGRRTGDPVFAFTTSQDLPANAPSAEYLSVIEDGLKECPIEHSKQNLANSAQKPRRYIATRAAPGGRITPTASTPNISSSEHPDRSKQTNLNSHP